MDMSQYLEVFIEESKEHLQEMNDILLKLEQDFSDIDLLNDIFRVAHTIKGMSGTMGFSKVASLTHEMENVLHICRSKELAVDDTIIDTLFECFDGLEEYIDNLSANGSEGDLDTSQLVKKLNYIAENKSTDGLNKLMNGEEQEDSGEAASESSAGEIESNSAFDIDLSVLPDSFFRSIKEQGMLPFQVKLFLSKDCALRAARAFIAINTLEQFGEIVLMNPSSQDIESENFDYSFEVVYLSKLDANLLKDELINISEMDDVLVHEISAEEVEELKGESAPQIHAEEESESAGEEGILKNSKRFAKKDEGEKNSKKEEDEEKAKAKGNKTVRVDIDRLDNLMNLVSELIIVKTRLDDNSSTGSEQGMGETIEYLERITTSLHDAVMKVRMVPVERTFNRFPRLVRDLSKDLGKKIKLVMTGEETEVDRTVIDEIGDPLIHLIRNSIDHGIENEQARRERGKPAEGTVHLMAYPDGNSVVIEVKDDGNGINVEAVAAKAISKGLVTEEQIEAMSDHEIINLLFMPGFSMAKKITDISGRGVGLDVVKSKIEALSGNVEVESRHGQGSTFIIRLPLTLAIIQALMVRLGEEKYAIPLNNIKIIISIKKEQISMVQNQEVILYRDQTLPIIRLADELDVPKGEEDPDTMTVVIVKKGAVEAGLVVDGLIGQQEIVIKSLGKYLGSVKAIAGATILGNGGVALIVDSNQLL